MTTLSFWEVLLINIIVMTIVCIIYFTTKAISNKRKKKKIKVSKDNYYDFYDACFAIIKDLIYRRDTFSTFTELADHVKEYYFHNVSVESYNNIDEETRDILLFGTVVYIVKEHNYEHRLIKDTTPKQLQRSMENFDFKNADSTSFDPNDEVLSRFSGKVIAHTKDPEESTLQHIPTATELTEARNRYYIERGMIPPKPGTKSPNPEINSMIASINQFYEE